jgi:hypothetical protein
MANLLPLLLLGGAAAAAAVVLSSGSSEGSTGARQLPAGPPKTDANNKTDATKTADERARAADLFAASRAGRFPEASVQCSTALSSLPAGLFSRLVETKTPEDLLLLGDEAAKLGKGDAASCIWASAARDKIDLLGKGCEPALLALPGDVLKDVAKRLRDAKDADDLAVIATSLKNQGYAAAGSCIQGRADAPALRTRVADEIKILGKSALDPNVLCDRRLWEIPDDTFKKVLQAVESSSRADLLTLATGLETKGYKAAASCIRDRAKVMPEAPAAVGPPDVGPSATDFVAPPAASKKFEAMVKDLPTAYAGTGTVPDGADGQACSDTFACNLKQATLDLLRDLDKKNPGKYSILELLQYAGMLRALSGTSAGQAAASEIQKKAGEATVQRFWRSSTDATPVLTNDSDYIVLAGIAPVVSGRTPAEANIPFVRMALSYDGGTILKIKSYLQEMAGRYSGEFAALLVNSATAIGNGACVEGGSYANCFKAVDDAFQVHGTGYSLGTG